MFWKTKKVVEVDGLPITLSKRQAFNRFTGAITSQFLAYKIGNEWRGLVGYEQFREEMDEIRKRQELILDHLKLKYVPETETKEPAKLVEKSPVSLPHGFGILSGGLNFSAETDDYILEQANMSIPKKKRGRPKKK